MRKEMSGSDACLMMHTALRKCCDSKITSCLYNLVHLVDVRPEKFDPWKIYGLIVADLVNARLPPKDSVKMARERLRERFNSVMEHAERDRRDRAIARETSIPVEAPREATTWMFAIDCALACFTEPDWEAMSEYLGEE